MTARICIRVLFLSLIIMTFVVIGCSGGGGGSSNDPPLFLSSSEAVPGSFITIEDESIEADDELDVTFETKSGYEVSIKTNLTKDGTAEVPVPLIANLSTGDFISSKVTVSIPSGGQATLNVLPLPELSGVAPGDIVKMYLSYTKSNLETSLDNMDEFSLEFVDYDTSELEQQIQAQIDSIDAIINEIEASSQMSLYSYYDGKIVLNQNDLGKLDQLLFAVLKGAMDEDLKLTADESVASASVNMLSDDASDLAQVTSWVKSNIKNSKVLLVGAGGMVVTVSGALIGTAAVGTSALYAFQAGTVTVLVIGVASEGIAAIEAVGDPNKKYEFGNEITKEIENAIKDLAVAAGTEKSSVINLYSFLDTKDDAAEALFNLICNSDPIPAGFEDYCNKWEASHQPKPLGIKLLKFYDEYMAPGVEGELTFWLEGDGDAGYVSVEIDWGDGDGEAVSLKPGNNYSGLNNKTVPPTKNTFMYHSYALIDDDAKTFTIKVHAEDSKGGDAWATTHVRVEKSMETSVAFSSIPSRIKTNISRAWGVMVKGSKPPYTYTISWGDGSEASSGIFDSSGDWTVNHKYISPGIYTVAVEVTDADRISVGATSQAEVRDPVSITYITGPTSLDVGDSGTWNVSLDGGWGPYTGSVDWGDFNITPIDSQSRQFNISHSYSEIDNYSFLVTIIDDEGDMDTKEFTVKMPKTDPSFPITVTIWPLDDPGDFIKRQLVLTVNDDDTITVTGNDGKLVETTELVFNSFNFTWTQTHSNGDVWTEIFEGTIDIDESTGVITGSGTYSASGTGGLAEHPYAGTWVND